MYIKKLLLVLACLVIHCVCGSDIKALTTSIALKGLGSPISGNGNGEAFLNIELQKKRLQFDNGLFGSLEAVDSDYTYKIGGNSNLAFFFGGKSKERCTGFLNATVFRDTKKYVDNQEELTFGGGVALIGESYKTYNLKYSVGIGGKSVRPFDENEQMLSRETAPIIDNRIKTKLFKASTEARNSSYKLSLLFRHLHSLKESEDFQLYWRLDNSWQISKSLSFTAGYNLDFDNQADEQWSDKISLGLKVKMKR